LIQRLLDAQLSTATNTIDILKMEIEKEEALLAQETKYVDEMEKYAKKAEAERRRQMKNVITGFCAFCVLWLTRL
jgi:kinetochore protein Fta7